MYENVKYKLHRELDRMDERYMPDGKEMNMIDLEVIEKTAHALKCLKAIEDRTTKDERQYTGRGNWESNAYPEERR